MSFVDWKGEGVRFGCPFFILFKEVTFFEKNYFYGGNSDFVTRISSASKSIHKAYFAGMSLDRSIVMLEIA